MFPEACSWSSRGWARERGRRGRERGGATPNHIGLAWEDSLLGGHVGAVNPASPAGESGWGNVYFSRGVRVLTRRKREDPRASSRGRATRAGEAWEELPSCTSRWGWMTTSLSSSPLHSVLNWGWEGPVSPGSSLVLSKGGIPAAREPLLPRPCRRSSLAPHTYTGEALRPRALLRPRGAESERALQRSQLRPESGRAASPAPGSLAGGGGERPARGRGRQCEPAWAREGPWRLLGGSRGGGPSREEPYKERIR